MSAKRVRRLVPPIKEWTRGEAEPSLHVSGTSHVRIWGRLYWSGYLEGEECRRDCRGGGEVRYLGEFENTAPATRKLVSRLTEKYDHLHFCYEAGPTGYGLYRQLQDLGQDCAVVAPSLIPKRPGERIKTGPSKDWGSSSHGHIGNGIDFSFEELSEGGAELAVEGGAPDLEQEIGAAAGPSHLLRFVHAAVDQEVGGAFRDRRAGPQTGPMAFGLVDQPGALAGQIMVDLAQRRPQP